MNHPRLTPTNGQVAHSSLRGKVTATRFTDGTLRRITAPVSGVYRAPGGALDCEALYGAPFLVLDETAAPGHAFGRLQRDGYVGYVNTAHLGAPHETTHRVRNLATHIYRKDHLKSGALASLPFLAEVTATPADNGFFKTSAGYIPAQHLEPIGSKTADYVTVLERFMGIPYLWGGNSTRGMDCSGAVQLALLAAGIPCPRDADMQQAHLGVEIDIDAPHQRGDLVFWRGHVGVMRDAVTLVHANATAMAVGIDPLDVVNKRSIAAGDGPITAVRRLS